MGLVLTHILIPVHHHFNVCQTVVVHFEHLCMLRKIQFGNVAADGALYIAVVFFWFGTVI